MGKSQRGQGRNYDATTRKVAYENLVVLRLPDKILTNNGREFTNDDMHDINENLNAQVTTAAAKSLWSNGTCKRHNAVISTMLDKIIDEAGCNLDVALALAISAKNSLHSVYGFSPSQLNFGHSPDLPSMLNDKLPPLTGITRSEEVEQHLNAKHGLAKPSLSVRLQKR